eukprot:CAMPEP_0182417344 /NCGR_PEP_ID=MMETSP1167-20130531/1787_1 /TAXON_ID=2988 /ORGANISM="Mallomonas Sp, Strain CCMP3275" /LENGTH=513 /DNA_ID=CAMNT_0024590819 /DNA_START=288 /DNA_END=1826 /DNA_ORIENTATION=-
MGPSGAGKSSLLNVLAGRSAPAPGISVSGEVSVGGKIIDPVTFRKNIAYVMQDDAITPTATPREALRFSASMRLPGDTSSEEINDLVNGLITELGIDDCADTMIGGALIKGISGGQRKRTSVGIEVITQPSLLFLDEPTSGLDSYAAYNCVKLLKDIAADNAAVLCTIHQPSSEVFHLFDLVIVMKEGRILYQGDVSQIVKHFGNCGYDCPSNYNPADYAMFICQTTPSTELQEKGLFMMEAVVASSKPSTQSDSTKDGTDQVVSQATLMRQITALTYRELLASKRDIGALAGRFGITIFLNVIFGLIFLGSGARDDSDPTNFNSHFGALTMLTIFSMFGMAQPTMLSFPFERPIFMREYSTGTYGILSYVLSKAVIELPQAFLQCLIQFILSYFMMGLNGDFMLMVVVSWGLGICSSSMAILLGCLVSDVKDVTEMAPLLYVPQLLFAGFFIKTSQIPIFLRWAQYLCGLKYAMNLLILLEFALSNDSCSGGAGKYCKAVVEDNDIDKKNWW